MTFSPTSRQVVLREIFDENSTPTDDEIREYALRIGVDVDNEPHLLPLAREYLMQPVPPDWKPCCDADDPDKIYYFNFKTERAQWNHPLEDVHRSLIRKASESFSPVDQLDDDSRTTVREDLKSFEEAVKSESLSAMKPLDWRLDPMCPSQQKPVRKGTATLAPLKPFGLVSTTSTNDDSKKINFDETEVKKRPNSSAIRNRRNTGQLEFRNLSKQEIMAPRGTWKDEGYATESSVTDKRDPAIGSARELTLTGGGTMFLKKGGKRPEPELSPKGILRKDSFSEALDIDFSNKFGSKEEIDDDKKSVRFNLEKVIKVNFEMPGSTASEDSSARVSSVQRIVDDPAEKINVTELDFEELIIDASDLKVPEDVAKTVDINSSVRTKEDIASSRNYRKSINIVLNGKNAKENINDNLIDLTDAESNSTADSHKTEFGGKLKDLGKKLDTLVTSSPKKMIVEPEKKLEPPKLLQIQLFPKPKPHSEDLWKISESEASSQSTGDRLDVDPVEKVRNNLEVAKADKLKELEGEFNAWIKSTEKMFKDKEKQYHGHMKEKFDDWKKNQENELIKEMSERCAEETQAKIKELRNELLKEEQEAVDRIKNELAAQQQERVRVLQQEVQEQEEKELASLKQSLETSLSERKQELYRKHQEELGKLDRSMETLLAEQRAQRQLELEKAREDEAALHAMRAELQDALMQQKTILQQEHEMALQKIRQQNDTELRQLSASLRLPTDDLTKGDDTTRKNQAIDKDSSDPRVYEKLRCEKRLLEDKYKSLKEKYVRLKTDVKLTLEKKVKKKEMALLSASETDKSTSHKAGKCETDSPNMRRKIETKNKKQTTNLDNVNQNIANGSACRAARKLEAEDSSSEDQNMAAARRRRQLFSKLKAASTSRLTSNTRTPEKDDALSPVENLRRQLKKLEELEDEFPVTTHTDTYLRYPFIDAPTPQFACSELEFFKHRIHLERDSVRRAKEFLKTQKKCYEKRQLELQHRLLDGGPTSKSILDQIHKEERELTEMEVSVHRTRALLGEKIIRLRHLEQSLRRVAPERRPRTASREDGTLSDLSSHSDSSGFSSTHHTIEPFAIGPRPTVEQNRRHLQSSMQESSEIIQSLENLNSEIRGIWEVLKQQSSGPGAVLLPPPPLAWPAVRSNPTADQHLRPFTQQMMTQVSAVSNVGHVTTTVVDSSLVERTRSLRDWLKSARRSPNLGDPSTINQVTL